MLMTFFSSCSSRNSNFSMKRLNLAQVASKTQTKNTYTIEKSLKTCFFFCFLFLLCSTQYSVFRLKSLFATISFEKGKVE